MNPLRYIKALFGLGDVDAFWMAREEILKRPGKHCLENYLCKIIRKRLRILQIQFLMITKKRIKLLRIINSSDCRYTRQ